LSFQAQKENDSMASSPTATEAENDSMASGDNRGQKVSPFGLTPIYLGSKIETELRK